MFWESFCANNFFSTYRQMIERSANAMYVVFHHTLTEKGIRRRVNLSRNDCINQKMVAGVLFSTLDL